jgi:hypothetical protein
MGITNFISAKSKQTAVYWGSPVNDGRGKSTFAVIEEVAVRWEDKQEIISRNSVAGTQIDKDGKEFVPKGVIYTSELPTGGWDIDGYIYLGTLLELDSDLLPYDIEGAWEIRQIKAVSALNDVTKKLYVIYL